jgi:hypothetical protein
LSVGARDVFFSTVFRLALGSKQYHGTVNISIQARKLAAYSPSSSKIKNAWNCITKPHFFGGGGDVA